MLQLNMSINQKNVAKQRPWQRCEFPKWLKTRCSRYKGDKKPCSEQTYTLHRGLNLSPAVQSLRALVHSGSGGCCPAAEGCPPVFCSRDHGALAPSLTHSRSGCRTAAASKSAAQRVWAHCSPPSPSHRNRRKISDGHVGPKGCPSLPATLAAEEEGYGSAKAAGDINHWSVCGEGRAASGRRQPLVLNCLAKRRCLSV